VKAIVLLALLGCHVGGFGLRTGRTAPTGDETRPVTMHRWRGEPERLRAIIAAANALGEHVTVSLGAKSTRVWIGPYIPAAPTAVYVKGWGDTIEVVAESRDARDLARRFDDAPVETRASRITGVVVPGDPNTLHADGSHCFVGVADRTPPTDPRIPGALYIGLPGHGTADIRGTQYKPSAYAILDIDANAGMGTTCGENGGSVLARDMRRLDGTRAFRLTVERAIARAAAAADGAFIVLERELRRNRRDPIELHPSSEAPPAPVSPLPQVTWLSKRKCLRVSFMRFIGGSYRTVAIDVDRDGDLRVSRPTHERR